MLRSGEVVVCDPDQGSISFVDPDTLDLLARVDVGAEPTQLLVRELAGAEEVLVTTRRGGQLVAVDPATRTVSRRLDVCAGPAGLAIGADGWLAVACEWQGEVREVTPDLHKARKLWSLFRPRAVAIQGRGAERQVASAGFVGPDAALQVWQSGQTLRRVAFPTEQRSTDSGVVAALTPNLVHGLASGPAGGFVAVLQYVANTEQAHPGRPAGYGGFPDAAHGVLPAIAEWKEDRGWRTATGLGAESSGVQAFAGPVAVLPVPEQGQLLVVHQGAAKVSRISLSALAMPGSDAAAQAAPEVAFATGTAPAGVAVRADGVWYVDNPLDNSITRIAPQTGLHKTRVRQLPQPLSAAARAGRRAFVDARNVHLSPNGVLSCDTCHPGGGDDGLVWFLHAPAVTPRLRRTQHLGLSPLTRSPADAPLTAGLHWDGEFAGMYPLLHSTVPNLMGGDALLLDAGAFAAFVREAVQPPVPPTPTEPALVAAGADLFAGLGCAGCHAGPQKTDDQFHAPLDPMTTTQGDTLLAARTPSLRGVFLRRRLFHDGRAEALNQLRSNQTLGPHYLPPQTLTDADFRALLAYLASL